MRTFILLAFFLALLGCSAPTADSVIESVDMQEPATYANVSAEIVANRSDTATLINVHIPYNGELPETDRFIPYNTILNASELPTDLDAEIILYCESGGMSRAAAQTLIDAGYTNIKNLQGGMRAWERAGFERLFNQ